MTERPVLTNTIDAISNTNQKELEIDNGIKNHSTEKELEEYITF